MSTAPYDIIVGPAALYLAPVGTSFPTIGVMNNLGTSTSAGWSFLGRTDGGVKVAHNQTTKNAMVDQSILPQKVFRTEDLIEITANIAEITLERYTQVVDGASVTTVAAAPGVPGYHEFVFSTGVDISQWAFLVVGPSPYMNGYMQYELARVLQSGKPALDFKRDAQTTLSTVWMALEDLNNLNTFGTIRAMSSPAE